METVWFVLIATMLALYGALDGFDLGAGIISPFIAKDADERRVVLRTIGPVWSGNEVWLIAAGGALFFAFPLAYASSFSGFYLSLTIVLWLLMLRGMGVELRHHMMDPLWWTACDALFFGSSALLALFFGVAAGNVVRGVPLGADRFFFQPLWTNFQVGPAPGILDWYTVLTGLVALAALTMHGASYVALKTEGNLQARTKRLARLAWAAAAAMTIASLAATLWIRPALLGNFRAHAAGWIFPAAVATALSGVPFFARRGNDRAVFVASLLYLAGMLGGAAFALYPALIPASGDPAYSITIFNAHSGAYSLRTGLMWWSLGLLLAAGYFTFLYRSFRGKVRLGPEEL